MTHPAEWNPIPHRLDVRCPACARGAEFEFAEVVRIERKADIPAFEAHSQLEYHRFTNPSLGQDWHGAVFFAGLHGSAQTLRDLPDGYYSTDWEHPRYLRAEVGLGWGSVRCSCGLRQKHTLNWPLEAYYQVEYRGHGLWAFHREAAIDLRNYVASEHRVRSNYRWEAMLRHVPSAFLAAKARDTVVKRLDRLLK